ncbi:Methyltransferase FkbM [Rhabdaerophilaceae bacterium]
MPESDLKTALRHFIAPMPVAMECPEPMLAAIRYVLEGEYESHHDGTDLSILDIGANVGSFSLWAVRRWPGSTIRCFEPNPETFAILSRNVAGVASIKATNSAVYPTDSAREAFFSRFAGDGEAGLTRYIGDTFRDGVVTPTFEVDIVRPEALGKADIVKLDIEGGEAEVLSALDLSGTALVLAEFQNRKARHVMQAVLGDNGFDAVLDEECPWDPILDYMDYRRDLLGDIYGRMFYSRRGQSRLTHRPPMV